MNKIELKKALSEWSWNDRINPILDTLISFAQAELERVLRIAPMEIAKTLTDDLVPVALTLASGSNYVAMPSDYIELLYLTLLDGDYRFPVTGRVGNYTMQSFGIQTSATGRPHVVTRVGTKLYFDVKADKNYAYEIGYYSHLPALTTDISTNWWTENAPEAMLYAALKKFAVFDKNDNPNEEAKFTRLFNEQIAAIKAADRSERWSGPALTVGQFSDGDSIFPGMSSTTGSTPSLIDGGGA